MITNDLVMRKFRDLDPPRAGADQRGVFIAAGPNFPPATERLNRSLLTVAPLVLEVFRGADQP